MRPGFRLTAAMPPFTATWTARFRLDSFFSRVVACGLRASGVPTRRGCGWRRVRSRV
jgi:hypothetical protein